MPSRGCHLPAVVVIGGNGHLGGRIAALLEALPVDVSVAGRRAPLRVDRDDASTLGALDAFDIVIDAADLRTAAPDAAARRVVEKGHTFVEISARLGFSCGDSRATARPRASAARARG